MPTNNFGINWNKAKTNPLPPKGTKKPMSINSIATRKEKKGGDLQSMLMSKAMSYGQNFIKKKVCSGDVNSIKANAIRALEMMPASAVSTLIQQSPLCSGQGNMFGGKKAKTRKLQRKQRKTRKH